MEPGCSPEDAFDFPFARDSLVFTGWDLQEDGVELHYEHVGAGGEVLCTLTPAMHLKGLGTQLRGLLETQGDMDRAEATEQALLALGMAVLCYVWMGFLVPRVVVRCGAAALSTEQLAFWRRVLLLGLREHLFVNGIHSFDGKEGLEALTLVCEGPAAERGSRSSAVTERRRGAAPPRVLVPMGAGKDSMVVWELLARAEGGCERSWFFLEGAPREFARCWRYGALVEASAAREVFVAEFVWPVGAFERARNQALALSGHPWACLVCFAAAVVALAHGFDYVAAGNERSAALGNGVEWEGVEVNHQWDKSVDFEREAAAYLRAHLSGLVVYFSALTPLWDLQVGLLFSHLCKRYLPLILSCNQPEGAGATRWCARCSKCAFVAAVLGAFLPVRDVRAVFGDDLFETTLAAAHLDAIAGLGPEAASEDADSVALPATLPAPARGRCKLLTARWKPLECVGGASETRLALRLVQQRYRQEGLPLPHYFTPARRAALLGAAAAEAEETEEAGEAAAAAAAPAPAPGSGCWPPSEAAASLHDWGEDGLLPEFLAGAVRGCLAEALHAVGPELELLSASEAKSRVAASARA